MCDILHNPMHSPSKQNLIFIIQCDDDKHFCRSWLFIEYLTKSESFFLEVTRIACRSSVSHMSKFAICLVGKSTQESWRNRTIKNQIPLEQIDSLHRFKTSWLPRRRLTTSNHWTFVVSLRIGVGTICVVLNIWILKILRSMTIIIGAKISMILKTGEALWIPCFSFKSIIRCSWCHGMWRISSQWMSFFSWISLTIEIVMRVIIVPIRTRTIPT